MLHDPERHEPLAAPAWDEQVARGAIQRIAAGTEAGFLPDTGWPVHPLDGSRPKPVSGFYLGACGIVWALEYLRARGAIKLTGNYRQFTTTLRSKSGEGGSYLFGKTPVLLLRHGLEGDGAHANALAVLIEQTMHHPARELMWGSPGTMLAALFMHRRTGEAPWADLFRRTAHVLWSELQWSEQCKCHFWTQDLHGQRSTYLDAVHGFVATASVLIQGQDVLDDAWPAWAACIAQTVRATAEWEDGLVNWRKQLGSRAGDAKLMQYCHGAPGFVVCLARHPDPVLDELLLAAGEATWQAGPLRKSSNLCHGTAGNGYAFLKLYRRTGNALWLERARAFAMHGLGQVQRALEEHAQWRHGLWTGDIGFAIYLLDCIEAKDRFPSLDVFDPPGGL
ncbi:lanthionine synthetase [Caenimonas sedimenti]|uniref:Lanthionine synthetase n=1 Tax=Caenimonas sedimenti TaxID=2596921 RepID=A0A562ZDD9_9BURK|nr:LanC-like protein [Caenimonas sedimenti]TWO63632.1 lanthionine synthetase [Caenimonas sedimenti]